MYISKLQRGCVYLIIGLLIGLSGCDVDPKSGLDDATFAALDIGIVNTLTSPSAIHPVSLSDAVVARHQRYEGIGMDISIALASFKASFLNGETNGVLIDIKEEGSLTATLEGRISTSIHVYGGEIGIVDGELYFSEGTQIATDDNGYVYEDQRWRITPPAVPALVITVAPDSFDRYGIDSDALHRTIDQVRAMSSAPDEGARDNLVQEVIMLEVATFNGTALFLGDIAKVQEHRVYPAEPAPTDESTFIVVIAPVP